jgi:outer membrane receptor protein involved in Fe transport
VVPTTVGNKQLEWEKVEITNYGVEFNYDNRLRGSAEYFINKRNNFLQLIPNDKQQGSYTVYDNAGDLQNKGFEVDLTADVIRTKIVNINFIIVSCGKINHFQYT